MLDAWPHDTRVTPFPKADEPDKHGQYLRPGWGLHMHWFILATAIVFETIGTTALKASDGFSRLAPSVVAVVAYTVSIWLLSLVLRTIPVGIAYAIWSGLGICLIAVIGYFVFQQRLDGWAIFGLGLIIAGILVINLMSNSTPH